MVGSKSLIRFDVLSLPPGTKSRNNTRSSQTQERFLMSSDPFICPLVYCLEPHFLFLTMTARMSGQKVLIKQLFC